MANFKKFHEYNLNENNLTNWSESLQQALKEENYFSGDENPLGLILDRVFSTGEKPKKEDVKKAIMQYLEEAIDMSFGEEWNEDTEQNDIADATATEEDNV